MILGVNSLPGTASGVRTSRQVTSPIMAHFTQASSFVINARARSTVAAYSKIFYNRHRLHSSLDVYIASATTRLMGPASGNWSMKRQPVASSHRHASSTL